jgi:hypothetical protein
MKDEDLDQIRPTLDILDKMGVQAYVIGQSPVFSIDVQILAFINRDSTKDGIDKWDVSFDPKINTTLKNIVGPHPFVNPMQDLCDNKSCPYRDHGKFLYTDFGHLSAEGSVRAVKLYFPLFQRE